MNKPIHTSTTAQRNRFLDALNQAGAHGITTIEAREQLDIMMPAARVHELRWDYGYNIQLLWDKAENAQGNRHNCARYVLLSGKWKGGKHDGKLQ